MPKKKKIRKDKPKGRLRTEHEEQTILFDWIKETIKMQGDPKRGLPRARKLALKWTFAVPNGYHKGYAARMKAKREGVTAGISDVCVPAPELTRSALGSRRGGIYHGLYIEMKRRGEKAREEQVKFMDYLQIVHYRTSLCFTWMEAARLMVEHLDLKKYAEIADEAEWRKDYKRKF